MKIRCHVLSPYEAAVSESGVVFQSEMTVLARTGYASGSGDSYGDSARVYGLIPGLMAAFNRAQGLRLGHKAAEPLKFAREISFSVRTIYRSAQNCPTRDSGNRGQQPVNIAHHQN